MSEQLKEKPEEQRLSKDVDLENNAKLDFSRMSKKLTEGKPEEKRLSIDVDLENNNNCNKETDENYNIKVYKRRWINIIIFICIEAANAGQWLQYSIIGNIIVRYYNISVKMVDYTSVVYLITYLPFVFPASYLIEKWGMRFTLLAGAWGNCIGSWLKVPSVNPNLFYLGFIGQTILSISQVWLLSTPARFAALWFGPEQVSTACSMGVFGQQLGVSVGFILTPLVVRNHENIEDIGKDLNRLFWGMAIFTTITLIAALFVCEKEPPLPPSRTQASLRSSRCEFSGKQVIDSFKTLLKSCDVWLMICGFGINTGILNTVGTFVNQVVLTYFPGNEIFAGQVGLTMIVFGTIGSVIFGYILDRTKKYKETTVLVYLLTAVGMFVYTFSFLSKSHILVLICAAVLGCFLTGYISVAFEFMAELTYPEPENNSSGLLVSTSQTTGAIFVLIFQWLLQAFGDVWSNVAMGLCLIIGTIITALVPNTLKRQAAFSSNVKYKLASQTEN